MKMCSRHPDRPVAHRGLCRSCYSGAQRKGEFKDSGVRYVGTLIDEIQYRDDVTWTQLEEKFERSKRLLKTALANQDRNDLITRVDRNSGIEPKTSDHLLHLVRVLESDDQVTWSMLARLFDGKTKKQLAGLLYRNDRKDLVQQVNRASGRGGL